MTFVVTGGASGIGRATALNLVRDGAFVIIGDIDEKGGDALASECRRTHNLAMDASMSVFRSAFAVARGPAAWLVNRGLAAVNASGLLKRAFARQALGITGELPPLARASSTQ